MALDPQFRAVLDLLASTNALPPMSDMTPVQAREQFRALSLMRRGGNYQPEPVGAVEDRTIDTAGGPLPVRVYTPLSDRGRVVTYFHGGGFVLGDLDTHDPVARMIANAVGAVVVSVHYRLAPEFPLPAALDDAFDAITWSASTFADRPQAVAGDSAGAALSIGAAMQARAAGPRLAALLLAYPPTDPSLSMPSIAELGDGYFLTATDMRWFQAQYLPDPAMRTDPRVDLLAADLTGLPPTVVGTAEFDPLRDEGDALAERLRAQGVPVDHVQGDGLIHGFLGFAGAIPAANKVAFAMLDALDGRFAAHEA